MDFGHNRENILTLSSAGVIFLVADAPYNESDNSNNGHGSNTDDSESNSYQ